MIIESIEVDDETDCDGDITIAQHDDFEEVSMVIMNKTEAEKLIKHLKVVFEL